MLVRNAVKADFERILDLNAMESERTSEIGPEKLVELYSMACYHKVVCVEGRVEAFLLVIHERQGYSNDNYEWFEFQYPRYLYIDRVVVSPAFTGCGLGSTLYRDLIEYAEKDGLFLTCEYNLVPLNEASKALHAKFGFEEVGQHHVNGTKLVSLQVRKT